MRLEAIRLITVVFCYFDRLKKLTAHHESLQLYTNLVDVLFFV